jgi:hypothetical protein
MFPLDTARAADNVKMVASAGKPLDARYRGSIAMVLTEVTRKLNSRVVTVHGVTYGKDICAGRGISKRYLRTRRPLERVRKTTFDSSISARPMAPAFSRFALLIKIIITSRSDTSFSPKMV